MLCLQETKAQEHQLCRPASSCPTGYKRLVPRREHEEGLQRRRHLQQARARRSAHRLGWAPFDDEGRYIEARFGKLSVVSFYIPSGSSGEVRQGFKFEVMDWLEPILDDWLHSGRDYVLCGDWNIVRTRAGHQELDQSTRRTPAACRASATGSTACAPRRAAGSTPTARCMPKARTTPGGAIAAPRAPTTSGGASTTSSCTPSLRDKLQGLLDPSRRRAFPTTRRSSWTTTSDVRPPPSRAGWRTVVRNLRQPKVLVMLLLGLSLGPPDLPGRQHARLLDARERHRAVDDRLPVVGRPGVFAEVPVGAAGRQDRCAGARALAGPATRLDAALAARRRRGTARHGAGAAAARAA